MAFAVGSGRSRSPDRDDLFFGQLVAPADLALVDLTVLDLAVLAHSYPAHVLGGFQDCGVTSYGTSSLRS